MSISPSSGVVSLFAAIALTPSATGLAAERTVVDGKFEVLQLATLDNPWSVAVLPDGRLLLTEKPGRLRIYADGKLSEPVSGVPAVTYREQGGLLDVVVDPAHEDNDIIYLSFVEAADQQPADAKDPGDDRLGEFQQLDDVMLKGLAVARGRLDGNKLRDVKVIWRQEPKMVGRNHFGGQLLFAKDGTLFITSGDRQRFDPAQDLGTNLGKIVRLNADGSIPKDNPFVGREGARADIWSLGHRNPLGILTDAENGTIWAHEMGPKGGDEINLIQKGMNYGWPQTSEGSHYNDVAIARHSTNAAFAKPALSWNPSISPAGFTIYDGDKFPAWKGKALMGGLSSKALFVIALNSATKTATQTEKIAMNRRIRDVAQAPDGTVYLIGDAPDGALLQLVPVADQRGASK
jgi:aldose sugar dehydrogenase